VIPSSKATNLRSNSQEEELIYKHVLKWLETQSSVELIESFRRVFIDGRESVTSPLFLALESIVKSRDKEQQLTTILDRCSRLIIYCWYQTKEKQAAITNFMELFAQIPLVKHRGYHTSYKLQQLVRDFTKTEEYGKLKILAGLLVKDEIDARDDSLPIAHLIQRYPFLYEHYLLNENSIYEDWQIIQKLQTSNQQMSEFNLSQYIIYKVRLIQMARSGQFSERTIRRIKNPTLLSDREISTAIKTFKIRNDGNLSYTTLSQRFLSHSQELSSQDLKEELYNYLIASIDPKYGKHQFNHKLNQKLQNLLQESNSKKIDELVLTRTCNQLLNFLIVDNTQYLNHHVLIDLVTHLGATNTVVLLLKLVLICPKIKPKLEKKFAVLFNHYKTHKIEDAPWLIKLLENTQIALSIHFGKLDLSVFKIL
jgi:hypothetical protein